MSKLIAELGFSSDVTLAPWSEDRRVQYEGNDIASPIYWTPDHHDRQVRMRTGADLTFLLTTPGPGLQGTGPPH